MFTMRDLQLEQKAHYITEIKFLLHSSVTTLYFINLACDLWKLPNLQVLSFTYDI